MNTPQLPPNHELLLPDFLRQHGAVKGMLCKGTNSDACQWTEYARMATVSLSVFIESGCVFSAPLGTIAAATTPVPEGRCECGKLAGHEGLTFLGGNHMDACPAHPRNAYVHILPHQLAQLPEKPEGLISRIRADKFPEGTWGESMRFWPNHHPFHPDYVYAVPRHVMDRIEQQLSTKGKYHQPKGWIEQFSGPEPEFTVCPPSAPLKPTAIVRPASSADTELIHGNAAPESSDPTGEAAPSDGEMLDWASQFFSFDGCGETCIAMMNEKFLAKLRVPKGSEEPTLRKAIAAAMKEDRK